MPLTSSGTIWKHQDFVKIWKDGEKLRAGFFNEEDVLTEEIPLEDLNASEPLEIAKVMAEDHRIRAQSGNGVDFELIQGNPKVIEENSFLSEREAELYVLTEELGYSIAKASEKMNISKGNAYGKKARIKQKIEKSENTADLDL